MKRRNKFLSLFLAVLMALSIIPMANIKAEATSQNEAVTWAKAQVGKSINHDGIYGAQCVDLIQAYYAFLGEKSPSINAYRYASVSLPSGWTRIKYYSGFVPQPGDIAIWTYTTSSNGHAAIITSATSSRMYVVEQNGSQGYTRTHSYNYTYGTFYGVIRPNLTGSSSDVTDTCKCTSDNAGEYVTNTGSGYTLNVRSGHGTSFSVVGSIPNGTTVSVTKTDGKWAHITYNGINGYVSMDYLEKVENMTVHCSVDKLDLVIGETDSEVVEVWKEGTSSKKTRLTCSVNNNVVKCSLEDEGYAKITAQSAGTAKVTFSLVDDSTGKTINSVVVNVTVTEKTKTYTVVYKANGGSGTMSNSTHTYNVAKELNANKFTRSGYTFLGWSQSSTATTATYKDKQSVKNLTSTDGATVTLYAVWQKNTTPNTNFTFSIQEPTKIEIRNKDGIILHTEVVGTLPAGAKVQWTWDNDNFDVTTNEDGTITIIAEDNGSTNFTATVYDSKGKVLASDTIEMTSKSGFFDKIGGFFRSLFGSTTIHKK